MARQTTLMVLAVVLVAVLLGWLLSANIDTAPLNRGLPWQIETLDDGSSRVFQIHLGHTTLAEVSRNFKQQPEFTMFVSDGQLPVIEVYFNSLRISGLGAKMVMGFELPAAELKAIYNRGVRISTLGNGERKVTLSEDDMDYIRQQPVVSITYIPSVKLDGELVKQRFGEPAERIHENSDTEHWLYPSKGLDIVLNRGSKGILQYVQPAKFEQVAKPLKALSKQTDKNNE